MNDKTYLFLEFEVVIDWIMFHTRLYMYEDI